MSEKRLFISFDYDHDDELRHHFLAQAERYSKHKIINHSLPGEVDDRWTLEAKSRIGESDFVVFICGVNTHSAKGVEVEMTITQQLKRPHFLLQGRPKCKCSRPTGASAKSKIHRWKWKRINSLLDE